MARHELPYDVSRGRVDRTNVAGLGVFVEGGVVVGQGNNLTRA